LPRVPLREGKRGGSSTGQKTKDKIAASAKKRGRRTFGFASVTESAVLHVAAEVGSGVQRKVKNYVLFGQKREKGRVSNPFVLVFGFGEIVDRSLGKGHRETTITN